MRDTTKFLIGVIQDYCNNRGYTFESEKFALSFGEWCARSLRAGSLSIDSVKDHLRRYKSFVHGNALDVEGLSVGIIEEICENSPFLPAKPEFYQAIVNFKVLVEGSTYKAFRVSKDPKEETGRSLVQTYLRPRGFREAEMSGGNSDLIYPTEETIIETKIWHDQERYQDGIVELTSYLDSQGYKTGYYVIFDSTKGDNVITRAYGTEVFDVEHEEHLVHCFFIKIDPIPPSKKRRALRGYSEE